MAVDCNSMQEHVGKLINALTASPVEQQNALNELSMKSASIRPFLFRYLRDERSLASKNIRLLNTFPNASEKYYLTEAYHIDQLMVRLLCGEVNVCEEDYEVYKESSKLRQVQRLLDWCVKNYNSTYCTVAPHSAP